MSDYNDNNHGLRGSSGPSIAERPDLNAPAPTQDTNATIPNCSCQWCSDAQRRQPTWYPIDERDTQQFGVSSLIMEITHLI